MPKVLYLIMYGGKMLDFSKFVNWKKRTPIYLNRGSAKRTITDLAKRFPHFDASLARIVDYVPANERGQE